MAEQQQDLEQAVFDVIHQWPKVLAILRDYDNNFPYAAMPDDDEIVTAFDKSMHKLEEELICK